MTEHSLPSQLGVQDEVEALEEILGEMVDKHQCGAYIEGGWFVFDPKPFGYLYCFSNESMAGILKIGMTKRTPEERLKEANKSDTWKPPSDYEVLSAVKCYEPAKKEKLIHKLLDEYRVNKDREFFKVDEEKVKLIFEMLSIEDFEDKYECKNRTIKLDEEKGIILNWSNYVKNCHKDDKDDILFEKSDEPDKKTFNSIFEFWCKDNGKDYKNLSNNPKLDIVIDTLIKEFHDEKLALFDRWAERIEVCEEYTNFNDLYDDWECYCDDEGVRPGKAWAPPKKEIKAELMKLQDMTCYGLILGRKKAELAPNGTKQKPKFNFRVRRAQ